MKLSVAARSVLLVLVGSALQMAIAQTTPTVQFQTVPLSVPDGTLNFGDFNADGNADAVGLNTNGILVYLGNGDGTFAATPQTTPVTASPAYSLSKSLVIADVHNATNPNPGVAFFASQLNGSGVLQDYGVILGDNNRKDGTFDLCENDIICLPQAPNYTQAPTVLMLAAADFNNDGGNDIAFATQLPDPNTPGLYDDIFYVYTGDGQGDLYPVTLQQNLYPGQVNSTSANPSGVPADILNNHYPYLIINPGFVSTQGVATTLSGLQLGVNNKNGTFTAGTLLLPTVQVSQFVPVDINGDKNLDIVYTETLPSGTPSTSVKAILGDGTGNFGQPSTLFTAPSGMSGTTTFELVDLNQDGKLDIVFSGTSNGMYWASGNGDGTFNTPALVNSGDLVSSSVIYPVPPILGATRPFAWGQNTAYVNQGSLTVAVASGSSAATTISSGGTATYVIAVTPVSPFNGTVTASCTGAPSGYLCTASPSTITLGGAPTNVTFSVSPSTTAKADSPLLRSTGAVLLTCMLIGFIPRRQRRIFGAAAFLSVGLLTFSGCGGSSSTPLPGSQTYTLTAQFTASTGQTLTQPLSLTITSK